jgi:hypothetical protein
MKDELVYPPCKKCGKSHGMGVEDMKTGVITPIDVCSKCLFKWTYKMSTEQIEV